MCQIEHEAGTLKRTGAEFFFSNFQEQAKFIGSIQADFDIQRTVHCDIFL